MSDFRLGCGRDGPKRFLGTFEGILQTDGYTAYDQVGGPSMVHAACWAHARRQFFEAVQLKSTRRSCMADREKAVFLLPYKALVNEKFDQFTELYQEKLGFRVIRCSGDYSDQVSSFYKGKYDLAILTYEMFLQLVVGSPHTLNQIGLVVLDEAQFVTDPNRGISVELLLAFILAARERGVVAQIIALSAVIGDANNFNRWLGCGLLFSTERPVPLLEGVIDRNGTFQFVDETGSERGEQILSQYDVQQRREKSSGQDLFVPLIKKLVTAGEKVIIFRNQRGFAQGASLWTSTIDVRQRIVRIYA